MKLYLLEPEVSGGFGRNTKLTYENGIIKQVIHLHYEFDGWLGDDLVTSYPCFIITDVLTNAITESNLVGYNIEDVEISLSETFNELYPDKTLPRFIRIIPEGNVIIQNEAVEKWSGHDFCIGNRYGLVVSESAFEIMKKFNLQNCNIREYSF